MERWSEQIEMERRRKIAAAHTMHGHRIAPKGSPEYRTWVAWASMRQRCMDSSCKNYAQYGARGITICTEWEEYLQFLADMGLVPEGKSLDRIDNSLGYSRENCRWATKQEQARNRRSNHLLEILGQVKSLAEWSELTGVKSSTIRARIRYGMTGESLIMPVSVTKKETYNA